MFPNCENALINASATARFDGVRAKVLDVQVKKQMKPEYDCAIKKLTIVKCLPNGIEEQRYIQSKIASCEPHCRDGYHKTNYSNE